MIFHDPRSVLKAHGLWTKKQFGQNFLVDPTIPSRIVLAGGVQKTDSVFEIGAGCGTLTRALAEVGCQTVALEYDRDLVPVARAELAWADHVEIREGNVLDVDWSVLSDELKGPLVIYGNLPYHLSSPIIFKLLEHPNTWKRACFLLQYEFAERLAAKPGTRQSSALSVHASLWAHTNFLFPVSAQSFHPPPKVESAVVVMEKRPHPAADVGDLRAFKLVVRALFAQRRKMARKALKVLGCDVTDLLDASQVDGTRRGESLSLDEVARISRQFVAIQDQ